MIVGMSQEHVGIGVNIFVLKDGKLLLGKRKNTAGDGQWGLPGGHLEFGETVRECAVRELKEETDLDAEELEFVGVVDQAHRPDGRHYIHFGFVATKYSGEMSNPEPGKCEALEWFDADSLPEPLFFGHVEQIKSFIKNKRGLVIPFG